MQSKEKQVGQVMSAPIDSGTYPPPQKRRTFGELLASDLRALPADAALAAAEEVSWVRV